MIYWKGGGLLNLLHLVDDNGIIIQVFEKEDGLATADVIADWRLNFPEYTIFINNIRM